MKDCCGFLWRVSQAISAASVETEVNWASIARDMDEASPLTIMDHVSADKSWINAVQLKLCSQECAKQQSEVGFCCLGDRWHVGNCLQRRIEF